MYIIMVEMPHYGKIYYDKLTIDKTYYIIFQPLIKKRSEIYI